MVDIVELIELLKRLRWVSEGKRQRKIGKGPASCDPERSTELTRWVDESQVMPNQLQGLSSRSFQEERD